MNNVGEDPTHERAVTTLKVALCSTLLLLFGSALFFFLVYRGALALGLLSTPRTARVALGLYYKVVVVKGLLPQLLLTWLLLPLLRRAGRSIHRPGGRTRAIAELCLAAVFAFAIVTPTLLSVEFPNWPALRMTTPTNHVVNLILMSAVVVLCAWLPGFLRPGLRIGIDSRSG